MSAFDPIRTLREQFVATRVKFRWWNQKRSMEKDSNTIIADALDADDRSVRGNKDIYSLKIPAVERINKLRTDIKEYWEAKTNPYGEDGVRLLPRHQVGGFSEQMDYFAGQLREAAEDVNACRDDIIS